MRPEHAVNIDVGTVHRCGDCNRDQGKDSPVLVKNSGRDARTPCSSHMCDLSVPPPVTTPSKNFGEIKHHLCTTSNNGSSCQANMSSAEINLVHKKVTLRQYIHM